jgi:hypothetical protein
VTDLPAARATVVIPVTGINGLAVASLACGLAQFMFGPLATIPAIVFGHVARHRSSAAENKGLTGLTSPVAAAVGIVATVILDDIRASRP